MAAVRDEEMELSTDIGQHGFGEDIDIDLDFAVGQPDEDMDLGEYDPTRDIENFNVDTRDELMAEEDDASYGMVDADDVDHNEAAIAANDIDIDIGDNDGYSWEQQPIHNDSFDNAAEITYDEDADTKTTEIHNIPTNNGGLLESSFNSLTDTVDYPALLAAQSDFAPEDHSGDKQNAGSIFPSEGVDFQDFGLEQLDDAIENSISDHVQVEDNMQRMKEQGQADTEHVVDTQSAVNDSLSDQLTEENGGEIKPIEGNEFEGGEAGSRTGGQVRDTLVQNGSDKAENDQLEDDHGSIGQKRDSNFSSSVQHAFPGSGSLTPPRKDGFEDDQGKREEYEQEVEAASNLKGSEHPPSEGSHFEPDNDEHFPDHDASAALPTSLENTSLGDLAGGSKDGSVKADSSADVKAAEQASNPNDGSVEALASVAGWPEMCISYDGTDYRLFAKSEDDDPNQYFLSDVSALELPLSRFLLSLRDVIAEEMSPLDEIVVHIDGLGVEFAESTAAAFLEEFTFGDILTLYDRLAKNDESSASQGLHAFLMVRPHCHQRLRALVDSANSGRGLSEIAVYRQSTHLERERAYDSESDSPSVPYNYKELEDFMEEGDQLDAGVPRESAHLQDDEETISAAAAEAELTTESETGQTGQKTRSPAQDISDLRENELIDFSDEELEVSSSEHVQSADITSVHEPRSALDQLHDSNTRISETNSQHSPHSTVANGSTEAIHSDNTSATATLNGEEQDEIDYSDDEGVQGGANSEATSAPMAAPRVALKVPVDDEITWESENEDAKNGLAASSSRPSGQVSPTYGKRSRSDLELSAGPGEENDVKRRRS